MHVSGLLFIGFAVHAVMHAVPSLVGRRVWIDVDGGSVSEIAAKNASRTISTDSAVTP